MGRAPLFEITSQVSDHVLVETEKNSPGIANRAQGDKVTTLHQHQELQGCLLLPSEEIYPRVVPALSVL